mmetsp:Transcript_106048/g.295096  ORF Transcript_106048/g.295096 Transcript_106048/m.295096 type:complete len:286 (+) Transcript_106048:1396-2253(+)
MDQPDAREQGAGLQPVPAPDCHRGRRGHPAVGHRQAAQRPALHRQRADPLALPPLAAHDRPAAPGEQVDPELLRREAQAPEALDGELREDPGDSHCERRSGPAGEHPGDPRSSPGAAAAEGRVQGRQHQHDPAGRLHRGVQRGLQVLSDHQAAESPLLARDLRAGDPPQLHGDAGRAGGPDARHPCGKGGARGGEEAAEPGDRERSEQGAAEGDRGQDPLLAVRLDGQHPGRRGAHQHPRVVQGHVREDRGARQGAGEDSGARAADPRDLRAGGRALQRHVLRDR